MTNQLIVREGRHIATTDSRPQLPKAIQEGIRDLRLAFPAGPSQTSADAVRSVQLYAEACAGFEADVVEYALQHLRYHNINNPWPVTVQDLNEVCRLTRSSWKWRTAAHYGAGNKEGWESEVFGSSYTWGGHREEPKTSYERHRAVMRSLNDHGPPPGEPGCYVGSDLVLKLLNEALRNDGEIPEWNITKLAEASAEKWDRFPKEILTANERAVIEAKRLRHSEIMARLHASVRGTIE
ncbi:hypothetical protein SAMN04488061_2906 [Filomicrobium insigne]|uniref:Uncharacterized protein n=1 Tax=Filomicrobium insigne TaxID=418854 RepID=A0A1H0SIB5_9HYPH|nr:hypothetical protein [Filomicrobium insigne]SDP41405.1 hypothetical protein SAMN04488061_2906 [Filomicrobium insigne]